LDGAGVSHSNDVGGREVSVLPAGNEAPRIHLAATPELPIPGGIAGPALTADTLVKRWAEHLPLHRLERVYGRDGLELARSTVCNWHWDLAHLVQPLILAMWVDALESPNLCTDATGVLVQHEKKCRRGRFFVVAAPERHILFGYSPDHNSKAVDELLGGYKGKLIADAHTISPLSRQGRDRVRLLGALAALFLQVARYGSGARQICDRADREALRGRARECNGHYLPKPSPTSMLSGPTLRE
jgi:hypothetical protein